MQRKRFNELEHQRKQEILDKLKAERDLSKEIAGTLKLASNYAGASASQVMKKSQSKNLSSNSKREESFMLIDK